MHLIKLVVWFLLQRREIKIDQEGQGQGQLQDQEVKGQEVGTGKGGQGHVIEEIGETENTDPEGNILSKLMQLFHGSNFTLHNMYLQNASEF